MTFIPYLFALPSIVLGHIFVLVTMAVGLTHKPHYVGPVLVATHRKPRKYSTTIGHGIIMSPTAREHVLRHELVHTDQYEDLCFLGAILGGLACIVSWQFGLILWATSGAAWLLPNYATGFFRFKRKGVTTFDAGYLGSSHERHAYAEVNDYRRFK